MVMVAEFPQIAKDIGTEAPGISSQSIPWKRGTRLLAGLCTAGSSAGARAFPLSGLAVPVSEFNVIVPMRDGVHLSANVFRRPVLVRYPAILLRTPYNKGDELTPNFQSFVNHGYVYVIQDVRGVTGLAAASIRSTRT